MPRDYQNRRTYFKESKMNTKEQYKLAYGLLRDVSYFPWDMRTYKIVCQANSIQLSVCLAALESYQTSKLTDEIGQDCRDMIKEIFAGVDRLNKAWPMIEDLSVIEDNIQRFHIGRITGDKVVLKAWKIIAEQHGGYISEGDGVYPGESFFVKELN